MQRTSYISFAVAATMLAGSVAALPALADTTTPAPSSTSAHTGSWSGGQGGQRMMRPGVFGTVASISGSTITVTSMMRGKPTTGGTAPTSTSTTYTVDATNAKVTKAGATSSVSAIAVGDRISVQGTVSGQSVTATSIMDGIPNGMMGKGGAGMGSFKGDGNPVVGGTVASVNGSTFTVTNSGSNTYTIDATNATVMDKGATSTVSAILSGDKVLVQGTVSGSSVTATAVIDQGAATTGSTNTSGKGMGGILGGIGGFFKKIFSFF